MKKTELLSEGKAKRLYLTEDPTILVQEFKDDATAFDGSKKGVISGKGEYNCSISSVLFEYLGSYHVPTHFLRRLSPTEMLVKRLDMLPLEAVIRNIAAGSLVKRLGITEGEQLKHPIFELYLKDDELGDPLINEYHAYSLGLANPEDIRRMFRLTAKINAILRSYFERRNLLLVDFKLEFGHDEGDLVLADEISPDTCRFWDKETKKKLDKDRCRFDLGNVEQAYEEVLDRISNI
ncbi:MAG: phosphoribosylaminoimidazolesuccinocarboxamide synthase [Candidatus Electryoneaceae bacterium]|nr:phosphoribosylaminoimidazolesuccinocarboxamide synthase [Candidatus Electryoneaceae bacterium]